MKRVSIILFYGLLLPVLAGCSMFKLAYNNADFVGTWIAGRYFDLNGDQKQWLDQKLEDLLDWHRREELPELIRLLQTARDDIKDGLTVESIGRFFEEGQERYESLIDASAPDAAVFFRKLTGEQIDNLAVKFSKDSAEFADETQLFRTPEVVKERRWKRTKKFLNEWVGDLSKEQETSFAAMSYQLPPTTALWFENRNRRRNRFIHLLRFERNTPDFQRKLVRWMKDRDEDRSPEYASAMDAMYKKSADMAVAISRQLTDKQKQRALNRLQGYIDDLKDLHAAVKK